MEDKNPIISPTITEKLVVNNYPTVSLCPI
jgi:hypothetical protein